ncbi:helix-turn-helix domain-containing protein [Haladaptatus sp. W1]|uniref:helix-turn-helix domain-containing protein n=1 Tax=Haladaptatus sp. W1 TaxID=1897478 RepID=UPI001C30ED34|nr:helix-turn-helix domain-containing protein [Haladaptatus sp. W1]
MMLDDQLTVLANGHRRRLLLALTEESPQTIPTVATATVETDDGDQERAIAMHHMHLPQLEDHRLIDWEQETGEVAKGPQFDAIEPLLTTLTENHTVGPAGKPPD